MLLELVPEELSPIFSFLTLSDLKNLSLCSKRSNVVVAPWLWKAVEFDCETYQVEEQIPAHIVHTRSLTLDLCPRRKTRKTEETKNRIVSVIKKSDPVSLTLKLRHGGHIFLSECLSAVSKVENFARLELQLGNYGWPVLFHFDRSYATKLKVLRVKGGELTNFDLLTSLVELKLDKVEVVSKEELQKIASLPRLKVLRVRCQRYWDDFGNSLFTSTGLVELVELDYLSNNCVNFLDEDKLMYLNRLGKLRKLNLEYTELTDALLGHLSNLRELIELNISYNDITDLGLRHVSNLTKLTNLNISVNEITDTGIEYLGHLVNLKVMDISITDITDAGIEYLVHLVNLKVLHLTDTKVNWSSLHQPKEHPLTRLVAAGCFVNL